jgi:hypothetical protein
MKPLGEDRMPTREEVAELRRLLLEADQLLDRQSQLMATSDRLRRNAERRADLLDSLLRGVLAFLDESVSGKRAEEEA